MITDWIDPNTTTSSAQVSQRDMAGFRERMVLSIARVALSW